MDFAALARQFQNRGLLIIDELFAHATIDQIQEELKRYISDLTPETSPGRVVYEPGPDRKIRNVFHLHENDEFFAELARASQFVDLASAVFNDDAILISVELFGKPAHVGTEVPYHQDNAYFNLSPDNALTCWLALADSTEQNGCVRYIEGSHKFGNLPHEASGVRGNSMRLVEIPPNAGSEVAGLVRRGGAIVHHCNTIHRSEPNRSDKDRPGLLFVYKAARCRVDTLSAARYRAVAAAVATNTLA